ncbi:MAG: ethanolamine ammonia-lyase subunit EutC [Anaerolineaceae bacterium]
MYTSDKLDAFIHQITQDLSDKGLIQPVSTTTQVVAPIPAPGDSPLRQPSTLEIDLPDPTTEETRRKPGIANPADTEGLQALVDTTTSRLGAGRAGPRYRTASWLLFQADQAVTQDTLYRNVAAETLAAAGLFTVQSAVKGGKEEYLLRPDLGRKLSEEAKRTIDEKCVKNPNIQICVGDGLSAEAVEVNLPKLLPVLQQGCRSAGLTMGTSFFIELCRVGIMNDIGDIIRPDVLMLLIGERPGLGRAQSLSIYMGYRPQTGHTDANRDVICNIFDNGGTNPLEAGAYAVQYALRMIKNQASGIKLKTLESK